MGFSSYDIARASDLTDDLSNLGFCCATKAGLRSSLKDLCNPTTKSVLVQTTMNAIQETNEHNKLAKTTSAERFQTLLRHEISANKTLKTAKDKTFRNTKPLNRMHTYDGFCWWSSKHFPT